VREGLDAVCGDLLPDCPADPVCGEQGFLPEEMLHEPEIVYVWVLFQEILLELFGKQAEWHDVVA
jgi:hypothetical protein